MLISNKLVYSDRLQCGNDAVANQQLQLPDDAFIRTLHDGKIDCGQACWMKKLMSPTYVTFIHVDGRAFNYNSDAPLSLSIRMLYPHLIRASATWFRILLKQLSCTKSPRLLFALVFPSHLLESFRRIASKSSFYLICFSSARVSRY